jgi:pimeloyl-ACP methyl ester carboxylesterase
MPYGQSSTTLHGKSLRRAQCAGLLVAAASDVMHAALEGCRDDVAVRPFRVNVPKAELSEMARRINATRWPERETVADKSQGVPLATIQKLARYWATKYDWRKVETRINALPNFTTKIDGLDIHFTHVRSKHESALPLIVTHGWPGSITHQLKIVDPLINPTLHGGTAAEAFHLVFPSMPGFGYSGKPTETGWDPVRIARAWGALMKRLGYERYVAQGGDWGALVTEQMAVQAPPGLLGIHTNMPGAVPSDLDTAAYAGAQTPSGLSVEEERAYEQLRFVYRHVVQYASYMASRPQTLTCLADSPVGLATFLIDFDPRGLDLITRCFEGEQEALTRDEVLDNLTLFWLTNTAVSAARLYWENKHPYFSPKGISIPVAVSVFPDELFVCPRSWCEQAYPRLIHYHKCERGGHFPAWEQPKLFSEEVRAAFRSLRV